MIDCITLIQVDEWLDGRWLINKSLTLKTTKNLDDELLEWKQTEEDQWKAQEEQWKREEEEWKRQQEQWKLEEEQWLRSQEEQSELQPMDVIINPINQLTCCKNVNVVMDEMKDETIG